MPMTIPQFTHAALPIGVTNVPVTITLQASDLLISISTIGQGGGRSIAVSGLGTWTRYGVNSGNIVTMIDTITGVTGTGNVVYTVVGQNSETLLYVVRGLNSPIIYAMTVNGNTFGSTSPNVSIGCGDPVSFTANQTLISAAISSSGAGVWTAPETDTLPSPSAWTIDYADLGTYFRQAAGHVIGSDNVTPHRLNVSRSSLHLIDALTLVVGEPGLGLAQLTSSYTEALTVGAPLAALDAQYAEALTVGNAQMALDAQYVEVLTRASEGAVHVFAEYVELLTQVPSSTAFVGWGIPIGIP